MRSKGDGYTFAESDVTGGQVRRGSGAGEDFRAGRDEKPCWWRNVRANMARLLSNIGLMSSAFEEILQ